MSRVIIHRWLTIFHRVNSICLLLLPALADLKDLYVQVNGICSKPCNERYPHHHPGDSHLLRHELLKHCCLALAVTLPENSIPTKQPVWSAETHIRLHNFSASKKPFPTSVRRAPAKLVWFNLSVFPSSWTGPSFSLGTACSNFQVFPPLELLAFSVS